MATRGSSSRLTRLLGAVMLLGLVPISAPVQADAPATVIGAYAADLLACPRPACPVRAEVPLREAVTITGDPVDGFVPVDYQGKPGFVYGTYLFDPVSAAGLPELIEGDPGCDRVALIFNVGAGYTPAVAILDTLAAEEVPATMFVMGWWAEQNPDLLGRMMAAGFPIGSHGHLPPELTSRAQEDVAADLRTAAEAITAASGQPPGPWFTPFAAAIDNPIRAIAASQGYLPVAWRVATEDWNPDTSAEAIYERVVADVYDGAIVEMHLDASTSTTSTAVALPWIIADLRDQGYRFVTIPEMARPCV